MSKDRIRNKYCRKTKRVIAVALEGKNKSENLYISHFKKRDASYRIEFIPGNETDPINMVNQLIKYIKNNNLDLDEDDCAFCIFDTDKPEKNVQIQEAIKIANENNIIVITSSPCIEMWFLSHYEYTGANMTADQCIKKLKRYCPQYDKNYDIYPEIESKTLEAIKNVKRLERLHISDGKDIQMHDSNPHSEMYKFIDEINK